MQAVKILMDHSSPLIFKGKSPGDEVTTHPAFPQSIAELVPAKA